MYGKRLLGIGFMALTLSVGAINVPGALAQEKPGQGPPDGSRFIDRLDKDADAKVSLTEFQAGAEEMFARLDKNKDGFIDESESPRRGPGHGRWGKEGEKRNFIAEFDKDADGKVAKSEFDGPEKLFERLDKNSDGFIDETEASQNGSGCHRRGEKRDFIADFDKDADGKVAKSEFDGPEKLFERLDKNSDGFIDATETLKGRRDKKS